MEFNIQEFLTQNKLTGQSQMRQEDDNTELTMSVAGEDKALDSEEEVDDWNKAEDDSDEYEAEPSTKDVKQGDKSLTGIHKKQAELQNLENQKDALLMQLKGDVISLDQYKQAIGNIPMQIKKLRADLNRAMNVTVDDTDDMTADDHIG